MPLKFLPRRTEGEPEDELEIRKKQLSIEKFLTEINLFQMRAKKYEEKFQNIDDNMIEKIKSLFKDETIVALTNLWLEECQ